jgi:hypothetical protein
VEWFSPIPTTLDSNSLLYKVSQLVQNGQHIASMIPVDSILSSIHLLPHFEQATQAWNMFTVSALCHSFYINPFSNHDIFLLFL